MYHCNLFFGNMVYSSKRLQIIFTGIDKGEYWAVRITALISSLKKLLLTGRFLPVREKTYNTGYNRSFRTIMTCYMFFISITQWQFSILKLERYSKLIKVVGSNNLIYNARQNLLAFFLKAKIPNFTVFDARRKLLDMGTSYIPSYSLNWSVLGPTCC